MENEDLPVIDIHLTSEDIKGKIRKLKFERIQTPDGLWASKLVPVKEE